MFLTCNNLTLRARMSLFASSQPDRSQSSTAPIMDSTSREQDAQSSGSAERGERDEGRELSPSESDGHTHMGFMFMEMGGDEDMDCGCVDCMRTTGLPPERFLAEMMEQHRHMHVSEFEVMVRNEDEEEEIDDQCNCGNCRRERGDAVTENTAHPEHSDDSIPPLESDDDAMSMPSLQSDIDEQAPRALFWTVAHSGVIALLREMQALLRVLISLRTRKADLGESFAFTARSPVFARIVQLVCAKLGLTTHVVEISPALLLPVVLFIAVRNVNICEFESALHDALHQVFPLPDLIRVAPQYTQRNGHSWKANGSSLLDLDFSGFE